MKVVVGIKAPKHLSLEEAGRGATPCRAMVGSDDFGGKSLRPHQSATWSKLYEKVRNGVGKRDHGYRTTRNSRVWLAEGGHGLTEMTCHRPPSLVLKTSPSKEKPPLYHRLIIERQDGLRTQWNDKSPVLMPLRIWSSEIRTEFQSSSIRLQSCTLNRLSSTGQKRDAGVGRFACRF